MPKVVALKQPTSKGYPPSVISLMRLIERTGTGMAGQGQLRLSVLFCLMAMMPMMQW